MAATNPNAVSSLEHLFNPKHIAIVGASRTPGKIGHSVLRNLMTGGFGGTISPVNQDGGEVEGLTAYKSVTEIPGSVDCAMIVVPAPAVVEAVRQCARAKVKVVVVGASGFSEIGTDEGRKRQTELTAIARESGMRIVGPNTNGIYNGTGRVSLGYNAAHAARIPVGNISIISHSGALFGGITRSLERLGSGLSKFVPVGNEADLNMLDFLEYYVADEATSVIGLVIEALSDGERLQRLAVEARKKGKRIVALKVGRSHLGAGAALAHSSRLAGKARAYDALFDACGIASVRSVESLVGGCAILSASATAPRGTDEIVCVCTSGAGGALLADFASERNIKLAGDDRGEWTGRAAEKIAALPARGRLRNPIDLGSVDDDWGRLNAIFDALEADAITGPTAVFAHNAPSKERDRKLLNALLDRVRRTSSPVVVIAPGGLAEDIEAEYRTNHIPVFHDTGTAMDSLSCHYATTADVHLGAAQAIEDESPALRRQLKEGANGAKFLPEVESASLLREAGVPIVESVIVRTVEEATAAAGRTGYPLVLKAIAPDVSHKNQLGFVIVNVRSEEELRDKFETLEARVQENGYARDDVPFVVQEMIASKAELIVGVSRESSLGQFLILGLGGIHTELFDEVNLVPLSSDTLSLKKFVLSGAVGRVIESLDRDSNGQLVDNIVKVLQSLKQFATSAGSAVDSIDINPLLVSGTQCKAVDALIVLGDA